MCAPRLQQGASAAATCTLNHGMLTPNQMDAMPSQREGQGFETP
jgi:hypothetical protein